MVLKNKSVIGVVVAVSIAVAGGLLFKQFEHQKGEALPKIDTLVKESQSEKKEMFELYDKRLSYLFDWKKEVEAAGVKPAKELAFPELLEKLKASASKEDMDLDQLDMIQNQISTILTQYLQNPDAMKHRPVGLEKLEESINRKRYHYHALAFEANDLMDKFDSKKKHLPVFTAEKMLKKQGLFH